MGYAHSDECGQSAFDKLPKIFKHRGVEDRQLATAFYKFRFFPGKSSVATDEAPPAQGFAG